MSSQKRKRIEAGSSELPEIPEKLYFTIGEVADLCLLKAHVLRYWEQEFPTLSPLKRRGNRRYYQTKDIILIRQIKDLLYARGFTIEGARQQLEEGECAQPAKKVKKSASQKSVSNRSRITALLDELDALLQQFSVAA